MNKNGNNKEIVKELSIEEFTALHPCLKCVNSENVLVVQKDAMLQIEQHIGWGSKNLDNMSEQGGLLVGIPYCVNGKYISVVENIIKAESTYSDCSYLKMGHETWVKMLDIYDDKYYEKGLYIVGWYHTHPDRLPVFMSGTDRNTQSLYFQKNWHFALVLNPHMKLMAFFNGIEAKECKAIFADEEMKEKK